jgi:Uma2 family endonuclease
MVARMKPARRNATYDDLVAVPEPLVAELIAGELYTSPRPAIPHARVSSALGQDLRVFDRPPGSPDAPGGWWILDEPELHFGADVLVPDLAGWHRERLPALPDEAAFTLAPDWACEVLSPSTGALDRSRKMPVYGRAMVAHLWLIDPATRTLEVYRLEEGRWVVASMHGGDDPIRAAPFEELEIDVRRWWGKL